MSFPVGWLADVVEIAEESVAGGGGGGGTTGVARASLKTEDATDKAPDEQSSPVLCDRQRFVAALRQYRILTAFLLR